LLGTGHVAGTMNAEEAECVESKSDGMDANVRYGLDGGSAYNETNTIEKKNIKIHT
jgi:hypothetical protein